MMRSDQTRQYAAAQFIDSQYGLKNNGVVTARNLRWAKDDYASHLACVEKGYVEQSRPRGDPVHLHATPYNAAIDEQGNADCENGQRGYLRRYTTVPEPEFLIQTRSDIPGVQGPTYKGRARVPKGQTFSREPLGRGHVHNP